ncbi:hypothetical protein FOZ63_031324, partial [Perkinsus olseni]
VRYSERQLKLRLTAPVMMLITYLLGMFSRVRQCSKAFCIRLWLKVMIASVCKGYFLYTMVRYYSHRRLSYCADDGFDQVESAMLQDPGVDAARPLPPVANLQTLGRVTMDSRTAEGMDDSLARSAHDDGTYRSAFVAFLRRLQLNDLTQEERVFFSTRDRRVRDGVQSAARQLLEDADSDGRVVDRLLGCISSGDAEDITGGISRLFGFSIYGGEGALRNSIDDQIEADALRLYPGDINDKNENRATFVALRRKQAYQACGWSTDDIGLPPSKRTGKKRSSSSSGFVYPKAYKAAKTSALPKKKRGQQKRKKSTGFHEARFLAERAHLQANSDKLLVPKCVMERCARSAAQEQSNSGQEYRWTKEALALLHIATERVLVGLFRDTVLLSSFARQETLLRGGLTLMAFWRGIYDQDLLQHLSWVYDKLGSRDRVGSEFPGLLPHYGPDPCRPTPPSYFLNSTGRMVRQDENFPDGRELSATQAERVLSGHGRMTRQRERSGGEDIEIDFDSISDDTLISDDSLYEGCSESLSSESDD